MKNGSSRPQAQQVQVCAWRIKYRISLPAPLQDTDWQALAQLWTGNVLELFPLPTGHPLYKLTLPDKVGTLTGSVGLDQLYAVLMRKEAEHWLPKVLSALAQLHCSEEGSRIRTSGSK